MSTSTHPDALSNRWSLFQNRNFRMLWASQAVSQIGDGLTKVALLWFVYQLTGSALKMTIIGLLQTIPPLVLGPIVGVYLDRLPKKSVMVALDITRALLIALIPILYALNALTLEVLFVLVFFTAIFSTAFGPALAASLPLLVKPSELMSANSLLQSTTNMGILIGPAICGVLIALLGTQNVLYVDAATFLLSALCLWPIKGQLLTPARQMTKKLSKVSEDLIVGMRFVFREKPVLRGLLFTTVFYTLGASAFIYVLPLFVNEHIEADPVWLGWLWSSMGVGMLLTSLGLSCVKNMGRNGRILLMAISMVVGGSALQLLAHSHSVMWGFVLVTVIGASTAAFTPIAWSIIQETTPKHLMGRVFTLINAASMAMASAGMVAFGGVADTFGSMAGISMIGFVFFVTGVVVMFSTRLAIQGQQPLARNTLKTSGPSDSKRKWILAPIAPSVTGCRKGYRQYRREASSYTYTLSKKADVILQRLSRAPPSLSKKYTHKPQSLSYKKR
ncbi:MAG: MFS transporter [Nitrospirales bacterium]|nr:MFS transporter [Nitrospirales bacterium]